MIYNEEKRKNGEMTMLTVILTGGGSRRMGRDKAMLPIGDKTMLQHLIDKYSARLGAVAVSVNKKSRFPFEGAGELVDRYPDMGPLNGIVSAFAEYDEDMIFITGTDLPFGEPKLALRLAELIGEADACIMRRGKKGFEPLFAIYRRVCGEKADECLAQGKKSIRDLLESVNVRYVESEEIAEFDLDKILMNVNTEEEYENMKNLMI